jgi:hypothetical protein
VQVFIPKEQVNEYVNSVCKELWGFRAEAREFAFARLWSGRPTLVATLLSDRPIFEGVAIDWNGKRLWSKCSLPPHHMPLEKMVMTSTGMAAEIVHQRLALGL